VTDDDERTQRLADLLRQAGRQMYPESTTEELRLQHAEFEANYQRRARKRDRAVALRRARRREQIIVVVTLLAIIAAVTIAHYVGR
jgi:hypothetical protein